MTANGKPRRAAIYARYSTDLQSQKSIEDQVALCRAYAERSELTVSKVYSDAAKSGASIAARFGWQELMSDAAERRFDVVIAEDVDRISRDQADWHDLKKRLKFFDIEIHGVHGGVIGALDGSMKALMSEEYLTKLAEQVHRGLAGVVRSGRHAGGLAYGYRSVAGKPGEYQIVEAQADTIRRIFEASKAGQTPREIARELNREGVPAPRGKKWNASTINGSRQRGNGILHNELYIGRLVWNRLHMVKDPDTGRRLSRLNPKSEWQIVEAPALRIVDSTLFDSVQKPASTVRPTIDTNNQIPGQKAKHLLSGLLKCATCGGGMTVHGTDRSGKVRIQCATTRESGTCDHTRRYYLAEIEDLVLAGLKRELAEPALIRHYIDTYEAEAKSAAQDNGSKRARQVRRKAEIDRTLARLLASIEGGANPGTITSRMTELEAERDVLEGALAEPEAPTPIALHPATRASYLAKIEKLATASTDSESRMVIRDLVESVVVIPVAKGRPVRVRLKGYLDKLTAPPAASNNRRMLGGFQVVAEEGFEPPTHGL